MFLEHVNLTVGDLERSIAFYSEVLGLAVRWRGQTRQGQPAAHIGDERSYLALFQATEEGRAAKDYGRAGLNHIGFVVEDVEAAKGRLSALDAQITGDDTYDPGRHVYFLDPDGIEVELVEYS